MNAREERRRKKKYRGDLAELMCDRKSSRRHAGKRESSSRTSESGSRSADGAALEIPVVIPDGKEFRRPWRPPAGTRTPRVRASDGLSHAQLSAAARAGSVSCPAGRYGPGLLVVGAAALAACLRELCHSHRPSPIPLLEPTAFGEFAGIHTSRLVIVGMAGVWRRSPTVLCLCNVWVVNG